MIRVRSNAHAAAARMREIDSVLTRAALAILDSSVTRIQKRMQTPGSPIKYPVNWDSEKQRQAYFASDGFGEGIPYRRKNEHINAWVKRILENGFELSNSNKSSIFLYGRADGKDIGPGKKQSNIHKGRHPLFRPIVDEELQDLPQSILSRIRLELSNP